MNATLSLNNPSLRTPVASKTSRGWVRWLIIAVSIPLGLAAIVAAIIGVRELDASRKIGALIADLKRSGEPVDDATMSAWYKAHTHAEGSDAWLQVISTVESITPIADVGQLTIVGSGKEVPSLDPNQPWADESAVADFLKEMEPVLQKIHQLSDYPTPVQFPLEFQGVGTLLYEYQAARSVQRMLQLDCEYAYSHGQAARAMQDLRSMVLLCKALESDICLVSDLVVVACKGVALRTIQRTLEVDEWSNKELEELRSLSGQPHFSPEKWSRLFSGERGMMAEIIVSGSVQELLASHGSAPPMPLLQSGRLKLLESYGPVQKLGHSNLESLYQSTMRFQTGMFGRDATWDSDVSMFYLGSLFGSAPQVAKALQNTEDDRRLTLTAIALRQFKKSEGRWPSKLNELEKVGLTSSEYNTLTAGELGYSVEEKVVHLWRHDHFRETRVSGVRPLTEGEALPLHMVRLK
jgi:hypothetical protein